MTRSVSGIGSLEHHMPKEEGAVCYIYMYGDETKHKPTSGRRAGTEIGGIMYTTHRVVVVMKGSNIIIQDLNGTRPLPSFKQH